MSSSATGSSSSPFTSRSRFFADDTLCFPKGERKWKKSGQDMKRRRFHTTNKQNKQNKHNSQTKPTQPKQHNTNTQTNTTNKTKQNKTHKQTQQTKQNKTHKQTQQTKQNKTKHTNKHNKQNKTKTKHNTLVLRPLRGQVLGGGLRRRDFWTAQLDRALGRLGWLLLLARRNDDNVAHRHLKGEKSYNVLNKEKKSKRRKGKTKAMKIKRNREESWK